MEFGDVLKLATRKARTVYLCLAGEVLDEIDRLEHELASAPEPTSLGDTARRELTDAIEDANERMRQSTVAFRLKAMPPREWARLIAAQPDRDEQESRETYEERLFPWMAAIVAHTVVEPAMTADQVGELVDELHWGSWRQLYEQCFDVNGQKIDVPNSNAASAPTQSSGPA